MFGAPRTQWYVSGQNPHDHGWVSPGPGATVRSAVWHPAVLQAETHGSAPVAEPTLVDLAAIVVPITPANDRRRVGRPLWRERIVNRAGSAGRVGI